MRAESKQQMKGKKVVKPTPSHWASNQSIAAWRAEQQSPRRSPRQQRQFGAGFDIPSSERRRSPRRGVSAAISAAASPASTQGFSGSELRARGGGLGR